ncbi:hypothetical protein pipiens_009583 [Culex pipiens pipiens]|uniref:Uncharacterized protein n=1 Tax=Culex pipiens pipiens TaxID=38569 RepID=A0ABD1DDC2_CULPP
MTDCAGRQGPPKVKYDDCDTATGQCCQRLVKFPRQHHKPIPRLKFWRLDPTSMEFQLDSADSGKRVANEFRTTYEHTHTRVNCG